MLSQDDLKAIAQMMDEKLKEQDARFDAKLDQRFKAQKARFDEKLEQQKTDILAAVDEKLGKQRKDISTDVGNILHDGLFPFWMNTPSASPGWKNTRSILLAHRLE